ncbi:Secondary metabolism regulator LAE1 [Colletotrichum orbiculare MAFF 240422]|uniref:Secondary metabolism regulator LAE1 n=1 Tax=Colletotrichum orbiculare (strain 104-T / ATCC 96160 / CBS 514.97 / LARS 414 / MAFF 240422) TaxID=1213857 RepID=A0A484G8Y8_COLOR|nr:Secondary metabolism regulator LAE1 [Colletotrichum orbiculare MAFF 240422]
MSTADYSEQPTAQHQDTYAQTTAAPDHEQVLEVAETDDSYETGGSFIESTASVAEKLLDYRLENGRTYHKYKDGLYNLPNDSKEAERLDLQHYMFLLSFHDNLGMAPPNRPGANVGRVLDIGTGTGVWAIDFGDEHPETEVLGVDLSAIQSEFTPPNVKFEIDDLEESWTFSKPFDYIHSRLMNSSISDWQRLIRQSFDNLTPGVFLEIIEVDPFLDCDDGTLKPEHSVMKTLNLLMIAAQALGASYQDPRELEPMMMEAGFTDIVMQQLKWPTNPWPKEDRYKELGALCRQNMDDGWEGICMAPLTRAFGWSREKVLDMIEENRKDFHNRDIHAYISVWVIYGKKPENSAAITADGSTL